MRRVLFATVVLVILLGSFSSAFAAEPERVEQVDTTLLGDIWIFYYDFGLPFIGVDAYLYRPSTLAGWPFAWAEHGSQKEALQGAAGCCASSCSRSGEAHRARAAQRVGH